MPAWQDSAKAFKASILGRIPQDWIVPDTLLDQHPRAVDLVLSSKLLTPAELDILHQDATALRDGLAQRTYTALQVMKVFCKAAAIVHQATNCLMDYFCEEALERARWLDAEMERTGKPVGPLHGVPISVKDMLAIKGHEITCGYLTNVGKLVPERDGTMIAALRAAGAVFYVKTTNPQAIMHLETDSFLGPCLNPHNPKLTPGGSSGGEGALIAGLGSVLGIGTDIGGSIRNPAANCGIFGFKPTAIRLPKFGNQGSMPGQETIVGAIGPMARSARDLELFVETVLAAEPWRHDPTQVRMPWRPSEVVWKGGAKPKVGVMWSDGVVEPLPPMRRALEVAVGKLKNAGFEVVDYEPYKTAEAWELTSSLYFTDGGERVRGLCAETGEPVLPLTEFILSQNTKTRTVPEVFQLVKRREVFRSEYAAHFIAADVDVILCSPGPGCAPLLGTSKYWSYTSIFNLVDYPGGVFPTSLAVEPNDVAFKTAFTAPEEQQVWADYDPVVMAGAPLSLQVVAARWEDESAMKALQAISEVVRA